MNVYQTAMDIFRKRLQTENEDLLRDMAEAARLVQIPKGTVLFREGEVLRDCYCLVDGIVRIYYTMNGEEITEAAFEAHADEIFDEAENRLHIQKAVMVRCMAK